MSKPQLLNTKVLPDFAKYPGNKNSPWNKIPVGLINREGQTVERILDVTKESTIVISGEFKMQNAFFNHFLLNPYKWEVSLFSTSSETRELYSNYPQVFRDISKTASEALDMLRETVTEMNARIEEMAEYNVANFKDLPKRVPAKMIVLDNLSSIMHQKEADMAQELVQKISLLGREVGIYLTIYNPSKEDISREVVEDSVYIELGKSTFSTYKDIYESHLVSPDKLLYLGYISDPVELVEFIGHPELSKSQSLQEFITYYAPPEWMEYYINEDEEWLRNWLSPEFAEFRYNGGAKGEWDKLNGGFKIEIKEKLRNKLLEILST